MAILKLLNTLLYLGKLALYSVIAVYMYMQIKTIGFPQDVKAVADFVALSGKVLLWFGFLAAAAEAIHNFIGMLLTFVED